MKNPPIAAITQSRQSILDRLQTKTLEATELPELDASKLIRFDDPLDQFTGMLNSVGGEAHLVNSPQQISEILQGIPVFADAQRVASLVPEAVQGNVDASMVDDPHALSNLDWVVARGEFCVAENGAIWVDGGTLPHRVMLFIPQYLAIIVPRDQVVHHMHEAYQRIGDPPIEFGVFVSGPSKTADIEQSLVLGAHGCRTLHVFLT